MRKVLVILLDAAEASLVEKWSEEGSLPNLARLRAAGAYSRTQSEGFWMAGLPWFPLYTGRRYQYFPVPFFMLWDPDKMTMLRPTQRSFNFPIFWREFREGGPRAVVVDMPWVSRLQPFNGIEIAGWSTHDTIFEDVGTFPPELRTWLFKKHGKPVRFNESTAPMRVKAFLQIRDELMQITERLAALCEDLLRAGDWDLFMTNLSMVHTAGHKLWDLTNVVGEYDEAQKAEMLESMRQVYIATDRAVGQLIDAAGENVDVLVFALHGMEDSATRNAVLPEMLRRILADEYVDGLPLRKKGLLPVLREMVPASFRHAVKSRLPFHVQDWLTFFWRAGQGSWKARRAIYLPSDIQGMIRINLKGREAAGIVAPGQEYESLCTAIAEGLQTFVDADTKEPVVRSVLRLSPEIPRDSTLNQDCFPDLTINWTETPAKMHRALYSPKYGTLPWPTPKRNPEGRSGNHHLRGFLLAAGPDIKSGTIGQARMMDIAPTILTLLGQPVPEEMDGAVLDILA